MIKEATIETQIEALENGDFTADLKEFATAQPHLMDYLTHEDNGAFTEAEQQLLFFAGLVIYRSIKAERGELTMTEGPRIAELEENNFNVLQEQNAKQFRERITVFFERSKEEELLAFIEDILLDEETEEVTPEGREPLFITLKTCMDTLLE